MFLLCIQVHRARSGRSEPRQDKDTNIFLLLFISQFGEWIFFFETFFVWLRAMVLPRPGLPQPRRRAAVSDGKLRLRLVVVREQHRRAEFEFLHLEHQPHVCRRPRLRFSVALPLGINGGRTASFNGRVYPKQSPVLLTQPHFPSPHPLGVLLGLSLSY